MCQSGRNAVNRRHESTIMDINDKSRVWKMAENRERAAGVGGQGGGEVVWMLSDLLARMGIWESQASRAVLYAYHALLGCVMVFIAKSLRFCDIPPEAADHMARKWLEETPFEPDVIVIGQFGAYKLEGHGNWFHGNTLSGARLPGL